MRFFTKQKDKNTGFYEARKCLLQRRNQDENRDVANRRRSEIDYALPDDKSLTAEQKAEIDQFWGKYDFRVKVDYHAFQTYYNRSGIFDPRYLPQFVYTCYVRPHTVPEGVMYAFQNKAYLPSLMPNVKQPEMLVRKVEGIFYDSSFNHITIDEAVSICLETLEAGREIVIKPSGKGGGKGVEFLASATREELTMLFKTKGRIFVVQKAVRQHPVMASLNESTVNTVRLTTILHNGKFIPAAALIKVGASKVRVDNYKHGGCILGVNLDGTVLPWAMDIHRKRITQLPSGVKLGAGGFDKVPCFDRVLAMAERAHFCIPKVKVISWDIAIDDENEAEIIEANFAGDLRMHQVLTGPVFGDMTEVMLDHYLLNRVCKPGITEVFDYKEFVDRIEITKYYGDELNVVVPDEINGKPVTVIGEYCFAYNRKILTIKLPDTVRWLKKGAFLDCRSLTSIDMNLDNVVTVGREVVNWCGRLDKNLRKKIRAKG